MSRIEVLLSEEFHRLLRKLAEAEQSTTSECARTLIETVLRQLDDRVGSVDEEALKLQFADFAREYPALRRELFDADADLRLDEPTAPSAESGDAIPSSSSSSSADDGDAALTGHLADRHVYAMAVRIPRDAKPDSDVVTMANMLGAAVHHRAPVLLAVGNVGQHWPEICDLEQVELRVIARDESD